MHGVAAVGAMAVLSSIPSGAQAPVPSPDSVVNAASFVAGGPPHYGLAPGGLAVIFGRNLASGTAQSQSVPYPEELLGTSVTVAGRLTVQASGSEASAEPRPGQGEQTYTLKLPPGTIRSGSFQVRAAGSSQAGPFTSAIEIPEPIRITTNLAPGTEIPVAPVTLIARLTVNWEGGDAASRVMVVARVSGFAAGLGGPAILSRSVPASAGTCILEGIPVFPGSAFEAGVWHYREEASAAPFPVERLGSPGWHGWRYEFRFAGLKAAIPPGPPGRD